VWNFTVAGLACIMLVNTHLLYPLLLDTVMKKRIDNPDPDNVSGKSLLTWAQVLKAVATFAIPVLIIVLILKLAGC
jgi:hypothetical protein